MLFIPAQVGGICEDESVCDFFPLVDGFLKPDNGVLPFTLDSGLLVLLEGDSPIRNERGLVQFLHL